MARVSKTHLEALDYLNKIGACYPARKWFSKSGLKPQEAWDACNRPDWMLFLLRAVNLENAEADKSPYSSAAIEAAENADRAAQEKFWQTKTAQKLNGDRLSIELGRRGAKAIRKLYPKVPVLPTRKRKRAST